MKLDTKDSNISLSVCGSTALVINKLDLAPYVDADPERIKRDALSLNPELKIFEVSCKTGQGIDQWVSWLKETIASHRKSAGVKG